LRRSRASGTYITSRLSARALQLTGFPVRAAARSRAHPLARKARAGRDVKLGAAKEDDPQASGVIEGASYISPVDRLPQALVVTLGSCSWPRRRRRPDGPRAPHPACHAPCRSSTTRRTSPARPTPRAPGLAWMPRPRPDGASASSLMRFAAQRGPRQRRSAGGRRWHVPRNAPLTLGLARACKRSPLAPGPEERSNGLAATTTPPARSSFARAGGRAGGSGCWSTWARRCARTRCRDRSRGLDLKERLSPSHASLKLGVDLRAVTPRDRRP